MAVNDRKPITNTSKRLPIVFCLDVSPSMGWQVGMNSPSIDLLNAAVSNFIEELKNDAKVSACAEVAFVTFSTYIEMDTDFVPIRQLQTPVFKTVEEGGTQMAQAVIRSIDKIKEYRKEKLDMDIPCYVPFLVLVTDGNPDENDDDDQQAKALDAVRKHCDAQANQRDIIVPFVIGVGEHISSQTLTSYAAGFTEGYFPITGRAGQARLQFNKVFQMIGNSTKNSIRGKGEEIISTIQEDMSQLHRDLSGE